MNAGHNWFEREWDHLRHHPTSAATVAATATIEATPREEPVSNVLTEAKSIFHDGLARLEALDETAINVMEAIKVNPGAVSLVNAVLGYLHLPPAAFSGAVSALGEADKLLSAVSAPAAEPQPAPAGPQVAGQA